MRLRTAEGRATEGRGLLEYGVGKEGGGCRKAGQQRSTSKPWFCWGENIWDSTGTVGLAQWPMWGSSKEALKQIGKKKKKWRGSWEPGEKSTSTERAFKPGCDSGEILTTREGHKSYLGRLKSVGLPEMEVSIWFSECVGSLCWFSQEQTCESTTLV